MSFNKLNLVAALVCLMLFAQTAAAWHTVGHHQAEHTKACKIYSNLDQPVAITSAQNVVFVITYGTDLSVPSEQFLETSLQTNFRVRAPPHV